jgi:hypothetical protein
MKFNPLASAIGSNPQKDLCKMLDFIHLLHEFGRCLCFFFHRLSVDNLGPSHIDVKMIFRLESIDQDIQVQFSHPGDDRLTRILLRFDLKGGIFIAQFPQKLGEFFLIPVGLCLHSHRHDRFIKINGFEENGVAPIADCIPCGGLLQSHDSHNLPGLRLFNTSPLVRMHHKDS